MCCCIFYSSLKYFFSATSQRMGFSLHRSDLLVVNKATLQSQVNSDDLNYFIKKNTCNLEFATIVVDGVTYVMLQNARNSLSIAF
jgi:hypothetical protein